jgi:hypothetical protein
MKIGWKYQCPSCGEAVPRAIVVVEHGKPELATVYDSEPVNDKIVRMQNISRKLTFSRCHRWLFER